ncbi:MAG: substrate-binding domain-containing protein, partial [Proteobacteria bacterium]|nr:substrate-binding domain-containing protein [Pseudomonadota bacterium]
AGAETFLSMDTLPEAILAINDPVAVGAYVRFKEAGVRIPQDVALVGFSDTPAAALLAPPLTTVFQPAHQMGKTAFALLMEELEKADRFEPRTVILPTELIVRGSS